MFSSRHAGPWRVWRWSLTGREDLGPGVIWQDLEDPGQSSGWLDIFGIYKAFDTFPHKVSIFVNKNETPVAAIPAADIVKPVFIAPNNAFLSSILSFNNLVESNMLVSIE